MELYMKVGEGDQESFEPIGTNPSSQAMKTMADYAFIHKSASAATPEDIIAILNLVWSVTSVQEAMNRYKKAETDNA